MLSGGEAVVESTFSPHHSTHYIPGHRAVEQIKENAAAMQCGPLTQEQLQEINRLLDR